MVRHLVQAWLVLLLALGFGAALAAVQSRLGPRIEQNKRDETYDQVPCLVSGAVKENTRELKLKVGGEERVVYKAFDGAGRHVGWVIKATGQGFADVIELLIGLDERAGTITGLYVLENKETPALGNKIVEPGFRDRFRGKSTARPLRVTKKPPRAGNEIQAISGATVSSESVTRIVNAAVAEFRKAISAGGGH